MPSTELLPDVCSGEAGSQSLATCVSAKRLCVEAQPSNFEEPQDIHSASTDEEWSSPDERQCEAACPTAILAQYHSWMDTAWRASEGQSGTFTAAANRDAGLQAAPAWEEDEGEEEDDPDEGEGEWEGEWAGAWEGCDDVFAGALGFAGQSTMERVGEAEAEADDDEDEEDDDDDDEPAVEDAEAEAEEVATQAASAAAKAEAEAAAAAAVEAEASAALLAAAAARAARMAVALPSVSRAALKVLDEEGRQHMTRLLRLHKLTQAAGSVARSKVIWLAAARAAPPNRVLPTHRAQRTVTAGMLKIFLAALTLLPTQSRTRDNLRPSR